MVGVGGHRARRAALLAAVLVAALLALRLLGGRPSAGPSTERPASSEDEAARQQRGGSSAAALPIAQPSPPPSEAEESRSAAREPVPAPAQRLSGSLHDRASSEPLFAFELGLAALRSSVELEGRIALERGFGRRVLALQRGTRRALEGVEIHCDGALAARTDARGRAWISLPSPPEHLALRKPGWIQVWSPDLDPATGHYGAGGELHALFEPEHPR